MVVQFSAVRWENELVRGHLSKNVSKVMVNVWESTSINWVAVDMEELNLILWINIELVNKADFNILVQGGVQRRVQRGIQLAIQCR